MNANLKKAPVPPGRPSAARAAVSPSEFNGTHKVIVHLSIEDAWQIPHVFANLDMSKAEALALAERLVKVAGSLP